MADYIENFDGLNMPHSLEAEQSVLGAILLEPSCINNEKVSTLSPNYFYLPQHKVLFSAMQTMSAFSKDIDPITLLEHLRSEGNEEAAGGKEYIANLAAIVPSVGNVGAYADVVTEKHYLRSLISAGQTIVSTARDATVSAEKLIEAAEQKIYEIRQGNDSSGLVKIGDVLKTETLERLNKLDNPETQKEMKGIPTGISTIDNFISGFHKSDLVVIGARPGVGKTSLTLGMARNVAITSKRRVAFFALEMSNDQLAQRILSAEAAVDVKKLRFGNLKSDEWDRIVTASSELFTTEFYVDETAVTTVSQIKSKLRRNRPDIVFIDYLQLLNAPAGKGSDSRVNEVSKMTRELKIMAKELNIPVVICSQLSRESDKRGRSHVPQLSDLRDSGSIEQDADIVLLLHRPQMYELTGETVEASVHEAQCIVAKNRHGETGIAYLHWAENLARFTAGEHPERDDY
ncbi:MAG: replicative DNA helicase [Clostridia bacterium]|nr:replicative DNA helicase [Clostridia bacterium]